MNTAQLASKSKKRRQAMALILVIITVALLSILIVAIFSITRTEYKATQNFVAARTARQLADVSVSIVQAQIQNAQSTQTAAAQRTIHATQPGMVRVYDTSGGFLRAHKLYSSSRMVVNNAGNENAVYTSDQVTSDWSNQPERFVDLNDPVVRAGLTPGTTALYFPVIDPRAAYTGNHPVSGQPLTAVEGFSYERQTAQNAGGSQVSFNEVVRPQDAAGDPDKLRLPMPVEWIYILKDGTTGALDASNKFISSSGTEANAANPIVGRVAFWTDDESCKVNINTAAEPTFFAPPHFYHERDSQWANYPGASGEYQRYPGHPATVALSTVLAPGIGLDPMAPGANILNIRDTKELIYQLAPKIAQGGSMSGTRPFARDDFTTTTNDIAQVVDSSIAKSERLFASVDEMMFSDMDSTGKIGPYDTTTGREASRIQIPGGSGRTLFDRDVLERSRFFLTAHSRAPEFSMHGLPRIAIWPLPDESLGDNKRTTFDHMIALSSTLRGSSRGASVANSYIFRRAQPYHRSHDVTGSSSVYGSSTSLQRNSRLLDYLYTQMSSLRFPKTSSLGSGEDFEDKYGQANVAQLAVQFFDYIRCTNLYDGVLARENNGMTAQGKAGSALFTEADRLESQRYTYTRQRVSRPATGSLNQGVPTIGNDLLSDNQDVLPGHGQVSPAVWQKGGINYKGFGRTFTLSEVGFQFICTADGKNDDYAINMGGVLSGGASAPRQDDVTRDAGRSGGPVWDQMDPLTGKLARWYSNFPPLFPLPGQPAGQPPPLLYGTRATPPNGPQHPANHPGYDPQNWNMTLANQTPLAPDEKRIQAMLLMEAFCPSLGWTKFYPEFAIVIDGDFISGIKLNGQALFDTTQDIVVKSQGNIYQVGNSNDGHPVGGHASPSNIAGNKGARPISGTGQTFMPSDAPIFDLNNTSGHNGLQNYALQSNFITVKRDQPMQMSFGNRQLTIKIYDSHRYAQLGLQPVQTINIAFQDSPLPVPALAYGPQRVVGDDPRPGAPRAREFNYWVEPDQWGRIRYYRSVQGPHWWCLNRAGALGVLQGQVNPSYDGSRRSPPFWLRTPQPFTANDDDNPFRQSLRGRLDTEAVIRVAPGAQAIPGTGYAVGLLPRENNRFPVPTDADTGRPWTGADVVRTMVPSVGDYRLIAAREVVPASMWKRHPVWEATINDGVNAPKTVHSFTGHTSNAEAGVVLPDSSNTRYTLPDLVRKSQMLGGEEVPYSDGRIPDLPPSDDWSRAANSYGDFDNGIGNARDGPYINKPDEGNFFMANFNLHNQTKLYRSGYFFDTWRNSEDWRSGIYMTPNRMIASPVTFGSLPTGVWQGGTTTSKALDNTSISYDQGKPWQTLLFRPYSQSSVLGKPVGGLGHPGDNNPRDHNLLDLFCMPVVEPYAISEPLSVAGRINLNYQIMPFTNIRRATGMHALLKGEFITAIPNGDVNRAKSFRSSGAGDWASSKGFKFYNEQNDRKFWHRPINVEETLVQFDEKFNGTAGGANHFSSNFRGLFRTASQICELHLIPDVSAGASSDGEELPSTNMTGFTAGNRQDQMDNFWRSHSATGDNTRERPYSNIYARVTTRSNTFRVHMRAQVIRKARSTDPDTFDSAKDAVLADYRGSTLIERYIDPTDTSNPIPDYGAATNPLSLPPLETFYKFRTLETKRFSP